MCVAAVCLGGPAGTEAPPKKKLILCQSPGPSPETLLGQVERMQEMPFDGVRIALKGGTNAFTPVKWDEGDFEADYEALKKIRWGKFTDNFIQMNTASKPPQDWFNDGHWEAIAHNVRILAKAARIGRCAGICLDPEPYGTGAMFWYKDLPDYPYPIHRDTKSYEEYLAKVRERGVQFVQAIQSELPKARILMFYSWQNATYALMEPLPQEERMERTRKESFMFQAFTNGMIAGAGPDMVIIDGNEPSYWYTGKEQYLDAYHLLTQRALAFVEPALWPKFQTQFQAGSAVYSATCFGRFVLNKDGYAYSYYMTPEEHLKYFEHAVYWALYTADEYVWMWNDTGGTNQNMNWFTGAGVPAGGEDALRSARAKLESGKPLDIDMAPILKAARDRRAEAQKK